jgi:hypothetical protein
MSRSAESAKIGHWIGNQAAWTSRRSQPPLIAGAAENRYRRRVGERLERLNGGDWRRRSGRLIAGRSGGRHGRVAKSEAPKFAFQLTVGAIQFQLNGSVEFGGRDGS